MSPNDTIIDDKEMVGTEKPDMTALVDNMKANIFRAKHDLRRQSHASAKKLKGFYLDFVFDRLNLTKYR